MKRVLIIALIFISASTTFAQSKKDSIEVTVDTLNLSGIVLNEYGTPLRNVKVNTAFSRLHKFTDTSGKFNFPSVDANDRIYIIHSDATCWEDINGSRFIKFIVKSMPDFDINMQGYGYREYQITAKRFSNKSKKNVKINQDESSVHAYIGHYFSPSYAGGLEKFYKYMMLNIKYPQEALNNNAEGLVKIAFVVKKYGGFKNIEIIRDVGYGCAQEVIRVLKSTERKWNPASNMGLVDQRVVFKIPFKLTD